MPKQDVQVKEVDVIRLYNQKFGDFIVSFSEHATQLQNTVKKIEEQLKQAVQEMKRELERIDDEVREARERAQDAYNCGSYEVVYQSDGNSYTQFVPDYDYIEKCRDEFEHLQGSIYHQAQTCHDLGQSKMAQADHLIYEICERTNKINSTFQMYVSQGQNFLNKVVQYIDQYKSDNLKV